MAGCRSCAERREAMRKAAHKAARALKRQKARAEALFKARAAKGDYDG